MKKIVILCGIISALIWLCVTFISIGIPAEWCNNIKSFAPSFLQNEVWRLGNGFHYDVNNIDMPQATFFFLFTLAFIVYFGAFLVLKNRPASYAAIIIFFAIIFRFILLPGVLIHENDIYRYIWDGKVLLSGVNPYKYEPDIVTSNDNRVKIDELKRLKSIKKENPVFFYRIGHRKVPTIYPPFAQVIFSLSNLIKRNSILVMKSIFLFFDILTIFLIYKILRYLRMNPNALIIYAWSPLVLKEIANSGHMDSITIFFLLCSIFLFKKKFLSLASLALSILSKFFPLVAVPLFLKKMKWKYIVRLLVFIGAGYLPFFFMGNINPMQVFKGLFTYAREWSINGGIFEFIYSILYAFNLNLALSTEIISKIIVAVIYLAVLFFIIRKKITDEKTFLYRVFLSIAFLFLVSPVGDPWYFCWVVPFLCFFPYISFIVLSWLLIFSYLSFTRDIGLVSVGPLEIDKLVLIQYVPFYLLLLLEGLCLRKKRLAY